MASKFKINEALPINLLLVSPLLSLIFMLNMKNPAYNREISLDDQKFYVQTAGTEETREKGLSGRGSMGLNEGMLFVFAEPGQECMWMKGMRFDLDMIWVNSQNKIIKIARNVSPDTYPQIFCAIHTKYVIELNSGVSARLGLSVGDPVRL